MVRHAPSAALLLFVSLACGGCGSVPDLQFADDGGTDGGPCVKTGTEICDDGIDNDCNGDTDCADSACKIGYACVDRPPDGWEITALAEGARPGCPGGFGAGKDVSSIPGAGGSPSCTCNCDGARTCSGAGFDAAFGTAMCGGSKESFDVKAQCEKLPGNALSIVTNPFVKTTAGATPSCNARPQPTIPRVMDGRTCAAPKIGGGCSGSSQVCVPKASNGFSICVARPGSDACPAAFPSAHYAGGNANDTRACGSCTCNATPCAGEVKIWNNATCSGSETVKLTASPPPGNCAPVIVPAFQARAYTSTVSGGCAVANPSQPSGSISFAGEETICCK